MIESQKSKKTRNVTLFNNRTSTATNKAKQKRFFSDLKGARIRSNYSLKRKQGLYKASETPSIEDKLSKINQTSFYKFKNLQLNFKNIFITNNFESTSNLNSSRDENFRKSINLLTKKYHSLKEINEDNKKITKKKLYFNKTPILFYNRHKNLNTLDNLIENKDKFLLNNLKTSFKNLTIKRQYTEDVITDNLNDLLRVINNQTVNNFNNKYHIKYKANNPKKRNKITKIFEMLKKSNTRLKSSDEVKSQYTQFIKKGRNSNSFLVGTKNTNTYKKTSDISIGTDDILFNKYIYLKQKQKQKDKTKNKSLRIHTLNLVNLNK